MSDDEAEALEIVENLERKDLTAAERKKWVKALAAAYERMDKTGHNVPFSGDVGKGKAGPGRGKKSVGSKVAEATGMSKRQVNRILAEDKKPAAPSIPGHTSSKDVAAKREATRVASLSKSRAEVATEGNTEDGHSEEGTEAANVTRFGEAHPIPSNGFTVAAAPDRFHHNESGRGFVDEPPIFRQGSPVVPNGGAAVLAHTDVQ